MQNDTNDIVIFLLVVSILILVMVGFIVFILHMYRKKQVLFRQNLEQIKFTHEKNLLAAQLEMQESTFEHISREIHDNINLSLTLAKLQLNTIDLANNETSAEKVKSSVGLLSQAIGDLSNISKSLNSDLFRQHGLINAIESELEHIRQAELFTVHHNVSGEPEYMDSKKELITFRIIQEAFNNIIKHAEAKTASLNVQYSVTELTVIINDDGKGFDPSISHQKRQAGLRNMETRAKMLGGKLLIESQPGNGTRLSFSIPLDQIEKK